MFSTFPLDKDEANSGIERAMEGSFLPTLELISDYLSLNYRMAKNSVEGKKLANTRNLADSEALFTRVITYMHNHFLEDLTINSLCKHCHCSESYLNHTLKKRLGLSFSVYINKLRIEYAKTLLLDTNNSMLSIALSSGFKDPNYFARVFRQLIDITPSEFRRRYR